MPNWGADIDVNIVHRKPDFVKDDDICAVYTDGRWYGLHGRCFGKAWFYDSPTTKIKLLANHPYYTKDKKMVISREAAIEALRR